MTDEEKQAIERLKLNTKTAVLNWGKSCIARNDDIETVLNLIEKQQAEIKDLKNRKERQLKRFSKYKENIENKHEEIYEDLVQEIEEKDKIIDEMAKCMEIHGTGRRGFSCVFRKDEECNENGCKTCIKEYFKKKVEDK